jgi:FdhD protein
MQRSPHAGEAALAPVRVQRGALEVDDVVAVEAPLEIRVDGRPLVVTMRTPGQDRELTAGFLFAEGIVDRPQQILELTEHTAPGDLVALGEHDCSRAGIVEVRLEAGAALRAQSSERSFHATAACGVCGKRRIEDLDLEAPRVEPLQGTPVVRELLERMAAAQELFDACGGIHAAALFDPAGEMLALREDIGRHNAVDKVVGASFLAGDTPLAGRLLVVSGRAGFEIVQKAARAGISGLVSVGAASSFAVDLARASGMSLYSFARCEGANLHL